jgi:transcriptional regulator with XRE-family HTH domain
MSSFDFDAFFRGLCATVASRNLTWKSVSEETGVSPTTLSRMGKGRQPDSESLTALAAWSGLNPVDFYQGEKRSPESMALVGKLLREDPTLDKTGAEALEAILKAAYEQFKRRSD